MDCLHLRLGSAASGQERPQGGAEYRPALPPRYMCLKTLDGRGPDGEFVHPDHCNEARPCFERAQGRA